MTVVLFDREHGGQADQGGVVGEDADDVGAAADLEVKPLQRVGRAQLAPVVRRERVEREDVLLGLLEHRGDLAHPSLELGDGSREPVARLD
jgi:hypothetical protein